MMRWIAFVPLLCVLLLALLLWSYLGKHEQKPAEVAGLKVIPAFELPSVLDERTVSSEEFKNKYVLLNFFASWCVTCRIEHPILLQLSRQKKLQLYGLGWKDAPGKLKEWLDVQGNPYSRVGVDEKGTVGIQLGITGIPESFLIGPDGAILYHISGPLTSEVMENEIIQKIK